MCVLWARAIVSKGLLALAKAAAHTGLLPVTACKIDFPREYQHDALEARPVRPSFLGLAAGSLGPQLTRRVWGRVLGLAAAAQGQPLLWLGGQ